MEWSNWIQSRSPACWMSKNGIKRSHDDEENSKLKMMCAYCVVQGGNWVAWRILLWIVSSVYRWTNNQTIDRTIFIICFGNTFASSCIAVGYTLLCLWQLKRFSRVAAHIHHHLTPTSFDKWYDPLIFCFISVPCCASLTAHVSSSFYWRLHDSFPFSLTSVTWEVTSCEAPLTVNWISLTCVMESDQSVDRCVTLFGFN